MQKTTRTELQERRVAPLDPTSSAESLNAASLKTPLTKGENSMFCSHSGSGYNSREGASMSGHTIFVLGVDGKPLTPTTNRKARKLLEGKQAAPTWNKFGRFGIRMLKETRKEVPRTVLGIDVGTKFEGYAVVCGTQNNFAVMWKLPDKKKIVKKLEERRQLRRARRWRNCRRRPSRFDNRGKAGFLAPSQKVVVQSRLKCMSEFFKCYPIDSVAFEDVKFNHRDKHYGQNFSTMEIGKALMKKWIRQRAFLQDYGGYDTADCRERYGYKKSGVKSAEVFSAHCSDALAIATDIHAQRHIAQGTFVVVDDTYRPVRRRLHDSQFSTGHIRHPYSAGNFKGVRKGTLSEHGQICGGSGDSFYIRNQENKRIGRTKLSWLSHGFKTHEVNYAIPPSAKADGLLAHGL